MDPRIAYLVLAVLHIPIAGMLLVQLFRGRWTSSSLVLHVAFLSYWFINGIRFALYARFMPANSSALLPIHLLVQIEAVLCLPLAAYSFPKFRVWAGLPCLGTLADIRQVNEEIRRDADRTIRFNKDEHDKDLRALYRMVRIALRNAKHESEALRDKEGMETYREAAKETIEMLEHAQQEIVKHGGATQVEGF